MNKANKYFSLLLRLLTGCQPDNLSTGKFGEMF